MLTYEQTIERLFALRETIRALQAEERMLREGLFQGTFPNPREGVNSYVLPDGTTLKGTYKINRSINREKYLADWTKIVNESKIPSATAMKLVVMKYDLSVSEYRKLNPDQQKAVDTVLIVKPGLPELELVPPKQKE